MDEKKQLCIDISLKILMDTGCRLKVKVKPLFLSKDEIEKMKRASKILKKIKPVNRILFYIMSQEGLTCNLRRKNGFVMKAHPLVPHAWEQFEEAEKWISRVLKPYTEFQVSKMPELLEWFQTIDNDQFPILTDNVRYVAFIDKRFDLETLEVKEWKTSLKILIILIFSPPSMNQTIQPLIGTNY